MRASNRGTYNYTSFVFQYPQSAHLSFFPLDPGNTLLCTSNIQIYDVFVVLEVIRVPWFQLGLKFVDILFRSFDQGGYMFGMLGLGGSGQVMNMSCHCLFRQSCELLWMTDVPLPDYLTRSKCRSSATNLGVVA